MILASKIHKDIKKVLKNKSFIFNTINIFSPIVHILFPKIFEKNIKQYKNVFKKYGVEGQILYALKSNKSEAFLEIIEKNKVGVDVSSLYELRSALSHGIQGENIGVSGSIKDEKFLLLAIQNNCLISMDSIEDIHNLIHVHKINNDYKPINILLRINDISKVKSRFGILIKDLEEYICFIKKYSFIYLRGFSFHINNYNLSDRVKGIKIILNIIFLIKKKYKLNCNIINIGGGFSINYFSKNKWNNFNKNEISKKDIFFNNKKFSDFYPYYSNYPKDKGLEFILTSLFDNIEVYKKLKNNNIKLIIEPGRSLLDQSGITVMKILGIKKLDKQNLIVVNSNFNHLSEQWFCTDFLPEPILLQKISTKKNDFISSVSGNTCMEADMLSWRKITFPVKPTKNDLLIYINTAAYQMDSNESTFHQIPLPQKVILYKKNNSLILEKDSEFSKINLKRV